MSAALSEPSPSSPRAVVFPYGLFLACLAFCLCAASRDWHQTLLEDQPFRQTQTAITTYYMIGHAPKLAYETPVLGPPWAIPYEFPLYQWLVALLASVGHTALDPTGRLVSMGFFLAGLAAVYRLLGDIGLGREKRLVVLSLLLVNPYYVYWSRSFLIESTAFCFGMWYLTLGVAFLKAPGPATALGALAAGTLGALVKVTTFAGFFLGVFLAWAYLALRSYHAGRPWSEWWRAGLRYLALSIPPVVIVLWWTRFADGQKELNAIGHCMTSQALRTWVFGTWPQRLDGATWERLYHWYSPALGQLACLAVCLPALCLAGRRREVLACLLLGLSGPLFFTSLYFHHEYYLYASLAFFVAAVGFSLVALWERGGAWRHAGHVLLALVIGLGLYRYYDTYYPRQRSRARTQWLAELFEEVQKVSRRDDVVLVLGCDWDSAIPYYSRRRALMIPDWLVADFVRRPAAYRQQLAGYRVGALVIQVNPPAAVSPAALDEILRTFDLGADGRPVSGNCFRVYAAPREGLAGRGRQRPSDS